MKIRILGKDWKVVKGKDQNQDRGLCIINDCTLYINTNQSEQQQKDTLLHEIIHAIDDTIHLDLKEQQVHALAASLLAVLLDNPKLTKVLFG